jgi:FMN reductase
VAADRLRAADALHTAEEHARLLVVLGSVTPPGRLRRALEDAIARAERNPNVEIELIDLADRELAFADGRDPGELDDDTAGVIASVTAADALLFATPVYRGSMTAALKNLFDQLPVAALEGKVVALAAMGASDHHFLGADRHLRDVLSFFGALVVPVSVYLSGADFPQGVPSERAAKALDELIAAASSLSATLTDSTLLGPSPLAAAAIRR